MGQLLSVFRSISLRRSRGKVCDLTSITTLAPSELVKYNCSLLRHGATWEAKHQPAAAGSGPSLGIRFRARCGGSSWRWEKDRNLFDFGTYMGMTRQIHMWNGARVTENRSTMDGKSAKNTYPVFTCVGDYVRATVVKKGCSGRPRVPRILRSSTAVG